MKNRDFTWTWNNDAPRHDHIMDTANAVKLIKAWRKGGEYTVKKVAPHHISISNRSGSITARMTWETV